MILRQLPQNGPKRVTETVVDVKMVRVFPVFASIRGAKWPSNDQDNRPEHGARPLDFELAHLQGKNPHDQPRIC